MSSAQSVMDALVRHQSGSGFCPLVGSPPCQASESWLLIGWIYLFIYFCVVVVVVGVILHLL